MTWGKKWEGYTVVVFCDNETVVTILGSWYYKEPTLMHMLRVLFLAETHYQFRLVAHHIPGTCNTLADHLSRNQLSEFHKKFPSTSKHASPVSHSLSSTVATGHTSGLDIRTLDPALHHFCEQGIALNTNKTYQSVLHRFVHFCSLYSILTPFPVSESLLCYFATHLACQQLSPQTVKVYMAAIRHMQITMGLPEQREYSSMLRLRLVQSDIQRAHASKQTTEIWLPITPAI